MLTPINISPPSSCVFGTIIKKGAVFMAQALQKCFLLFFPSKFCVKKVSTDPKVTERGGGWPPLDRIFRNYRLISLKCTWSLREDFGWRTKKYHNFFSIYEKMIFFLRLGSLTPPLLVVRPIKQMVCFPYVLTASASFEEMISWSARTESACSITNTHWDKSGGIF